MSDSAPLIDSDDFSTRLMQMTTLVSILVWGKVDKASELIRSFCSVMLLRLAC